VSAYQTLILDLLIKQVKVNGLRCTGIDMILLIFSLWHYGLMVFYVICVGGVFVLLYIVLLDYKLYLLTYRAQCLCRIFTNLAESFLYHVIHQPGTELGDMAIMDMLVQCVKHPDYEVCLSVLPCTYVCACVCVCVSVCVCMCVR